MSTTPIYDQLVLDRTPLGQVPTPPIPDELPRRATEEGLPLSTYLSRHTYEHAVRHRPDSEDVRKTALLLSEVCPKCKAPQGLWCEYATSRPGRFTAIHAARQALAKQ